MKTDLRIPEPHPGQRILLEAKERFVLGRCGRRFGKTTVCEIKAKWTALTPVPIAYFAPSYKFVKPMWELLKGELLPLISSISEADRQMRLITGASIDFWSLDNPNAGRGNKYKLVIIDEAREVGKLEEAWNQSIRPMLIDLKGEALIVSSPQGHGTFFHRMYETAKTDVNWFAYTGTSFENPVLSKTELHAAALTMDEMSYQQEIMGEDVEWAENARYFDKFTRAQHVRECEYDKRDILRLSFDFNVDPMTCIAYQTDKWNYFKVVREFRIPNSDIFAMCQAIKDFFETDHIPIYKITGDPAGKARNAGMRNNSFDIIRQELGTNQINVLKSHPTHADSRTFVNAVMATAPIVIDPSCEWLIKDMEFVLMGRNRNGEVIILKDDKLNPFINMKNSELNHLGDCFRYALHTDLKSFLKDSPLPLPRKEAKFPANIQL